jgi:NAD(P)-dependent dehydrogenase (short-subunit alcohol dehydrogenase family)
MIDHAYLEKIFGLEGKVAVVTGGGGVLCSAMAQALSRAGAKLAIVDLSEEAASRTTANIQAMHGEALAVPCDVLSRESVQAASEVILQRWGRVDILVNGAGGNRPQATTAPERPFFDLPQEAIRWVFDLNVFGTILACQVFGKGMAEQRSGVILNIASMNSFRPLTRIPAYSAAKAAVVNFTQWLAVHMAQEYSPEIRVNAMAPGFLFTEQNRYLVTDAATGGLTPRGQKIVDHVPQGRFQTTEELLSTLIWLVSPGASAITGIVVPVDGGFSAFSGV